MVESLKEPADLTEWAKAFLEDFNADKPWYEHKSANDLYYFLACREGLGFKEAAILVYGEEFLKFPDDWRILAKQMRENNKTIADISGFCRLIYLYLPRHPTESEICRLLSPEQAEKQKQYDMAYHWRNKAKRNAARLARYHRNK